MSVNEVQKTVTYLREAQEVALFASMSNSRLQAAFAASPLFYIMLPFIGLLMTISASLNSYRLAKADNKNLDKWSHAIASSLCAALASVSVYGSALSVLLGFHFAAGPWFFLGSVIAGITHQSMMMGINFYRAFKAPGNSVQRKHFLQAALNNLFVTGLLSAVVGTVLFVMLFPTVAPLIGSVFAVTAALFTFSDIMWRIIPYNWKRSTKGAINLGKPELPHNHALKSEISLIETHSQDLNPKHHKVFSCNDHSAVVKKLDAESAKNYLNLQIKKKIDSYGDGLSFRDKKTQDKFLFLKESLASVDESAVPSKKSLLKKHPLAFQSFWLEKGEVEQLFDAVVVLHEKLNQLDLANRAACDVSPH